MHLSAPVPLRVRKLFNALLLQAVDNLPERTSYRLPLDILSALSGPDQVACDLQTLCRTVLEWRDPEGNWGTSPLLAYAGCEAREVSYAVSPVLGHLLANPPGRARVQDAMQSAVTGGHVLALYRLCAPWTGKGRTPWWPVDQLRAALGCETSAYYAEFKHFNAKLLKPAIADLAEGSDLSISVRFRRDGRTVSHLRFDIVLRSEITVTDQCALKESKQLEDLRHRGVSLHLAQHLLSLGGRVATASQMTRAERLAVIHWLVSNRPQAQQDADKAAFLARVSDPLQKQDFERFSWMSSRNAAAIGEFWEDRAPEAFAALRQSR